MPDLAKSLCVVVWDHHVCPDFDFLPCDDESASGLHWKLSGAGRPHTETHDLEVARVRGPEPGKQTCEIYILLVYQKT